MKKRSGFVYVWYDKKKKMYYIGSHWGNEDDRYICSSIWMNRTYKRRPTDFKRRIVARVATTKLDLLKEEQRWLNMIDPNKMIPKNTTIKKRNGIRYYNIVKTAFKLWHSYDENIKTVGQKISAAKRGKNTGPRPLEVGIAISKAKKGTPLTPEHRTALTGIKHTPHTQQWKDDSSIRLKEQWSNGTRKSTIQDQWNDGRRSREALSARMKGKTISEEQKAILRDTNSLTWLITHPNGRMEVVKNLKAFCEKNGLQHTNLGKVAQGKLRQHRGFKARKLDLQDTVLA